VVGTAQCQCGTDIQTPGHILQDCPNFAADILHSWPVVADLTKGQAVGTTGRICPDCNVWGCHKPESLRYGQYRTQKKKKKKKMGMELSHNSAVAMKAYMSISTKTFFCTVTSPANEIIIVEVYNFDI
jgi:hypothetical protein